MGDFWELVAMTIIEYHRKFGFASDQRGATTGAVNGRQLDRELSEIELALMSQRGVLGGLTTAAGGLAAAVVGVDQLKSSVVALIGSQGWVFRGAWATGVQYVPGDFVSHEGLGFVAVVAHTSGGSFGDDLAAVRWVPLATSAAAEVSLAPVSGMVATDVQGGIAELRAGLTAFAAPATESLAINGSFRIYYGPGTLTTGFSGQVCERWWEDQIGSSITAQILQHPLGSMPGESPDFHRVVVTSVAGSGNRAMSFSRIADVLSIAGKRLIVAFNARADATKPISVKVGQYFGAGGSPSASVGVAAQKVLLTNSWQRFRLAFDMPSVTGKTLGTDGRHHTHVIFWYDAGTSFDGETAILGQQSGTFDLDTVKFYLGELTTPEPPLTRYEQDVRNAMVFREFGSWGFGGYTPIANFGLLNTVRFTERKYPVPGITVSPYNVVYGTGNAFGHDLTVNGANQDGFRLTVFSHAANPNFVFTDCDWVADTGM